MVTGITYTVAVAIGLSRINIASAVVVAAFGITTCARAVACGPRFVPVIQDRVVIVIVVANIAKPCCPFIPSAVSVTTDTA